MGRSPCCSKEGLNRRAWTAREDMILSVYIKTQGHGEWKNLPIKAGLNRCGRSCRLRWLNYLRPDIKRGNISPDEVELIIRLHRLLGNRWSLIAGRLPGRTDNEIKNYWNTHLRKKLTMDECQPTNLKTRTKSPCDLQNHTFETIPLEAMAARYSEGANDCNGDSMNSRSHQYCKVSDVEEIRSSCGFVVDDSLRGKDSECIALTVEDTKLVGTEVRNSAWSMCNLGHQQLLHSHEFVGERATIAESLLDFNIFSPRLHLLSCPSNSSTDILFRKFDTGSPASLAAGTNEIEDLYSVQNNIQHVNSFTIFDGRAGNEGFFDKVQSVDCIHELDYLEEPAAEWLSDLLLACEE